MITPWSSKKPDEEDDPNDPPDKIHSPKTTIKPHNILFLKMIK
jgi:hypothetical protein